MLNFVPTSRIATFFVIEMLLSVSKFARFIGNNFLCSYFVNYTANGIFFNFSRTADKSSGFSVVIMPFIVPFSLSRLVRALVSIPSIPGMSCSTRNCWILSSFLKLLPSLASSLTINASVFDFSPLCLDYKYHNYQLTDRSLLLPVQA